MIRSGTRTVVVGGFLALSAQAMAQQPMDIASKTTSPPIATAWGTDSFERYTTPGQCQQAAMRLMQRYWRDRRRDTVVYAPATDSVPTLVTRDVQRCLARFIVASTPVDELRDLAQLSLWVGNDTLARAALSRLTQESRMQSASTRAWTLYLWVNALVSAKPARVTLARDYLSQLDALGAPAAIWRMYAHTRLSDYARSVNDRAMAEAEGRAAIAASHQMSNPERVDNVYAIDDAYMATATPIGYARGGAAGLALLDTMLTDLTPLRPAGSADQAELVRGLRSERLRLTSLGKQGPPVHATRWFGAQGDTVFPKPGRLTLVVFTYGPDYPMFATLHRLSAAYAARGLDIVGISSTTGYYRTLPMPTPAVEIDSVGSYVQNFLHLPLTLAIETTPFYHLSDGRRRNKETPNQEAYGHFGGCVLLDRHGVIRWVGGVDAMAEPLLNAVIRDAL